MITELDLKEAIAECEGTKNPTVNTCIKLAAFYTIREHLFGEDSNVEKHLYSGSSGIRYSSSEFSEIVKDKGIEVCFPVIDELIATVYVMNPILYRNVIQKLTDL